MVAGFVPDGEAMKIKNIKIGDWLRSINSNNVTSQNLEQILSEITTPSNVRILKKYKLVSPVYNSIYNFI